MYRVHDDEKSNLLRTGDPLAWFAELILSDERGQWRRALAAQAELDRLGWQVKRKARHTPQTAPGREGGR